MTVRDAVPGDGQQIAECKRRSWRTAYRGLLPDRVLDRLGLRPSPDYYELRIAAGHPPIVAVDGHGAIMALGEVGAARDLDVPAGTGELLMLYADPTVWGTGVGHEVHGRCLERLAALGHAEAVLWVLEGNHRAIDFYERHGWRRDGTTRTDSIGTTALHELRMRISVRT